MLSCVVMQPTTLCNLNCEYCYLPMRSERNVMETTTARAVARALRDHHGVRRPVDVVWHGGEPLSLGPKAFAGLLDQFYDVDVEHSVQTNGTLIDDRWLDLLSERGVNIGISIDGDRAASARRIDRAGAPAFERIMCGIEKLRARGVEFDVIAVVSDPNPAVARDMYTFMAELGCRSLGVNIEEQEGANLRPGRREASRVRGFWAALADAWLERPAIPIRELERIVHYVTGSGDRSTGAVQPSRLDPFPTVAWNGTVTLISPELAGYSSPRLGPFACGDVRHADLVDLVVEGMDAAWVSEFRRGMARCEAQCPYFSFCGGGTPANRYFESGRLDTTETDYCRNSRIALIGGVTGDAASTGDVTQQLITSTRVHEMLTRATRTHPESRDDGRFDNRPAWDNWGKNGRKFDNTPAWDNWDKRWNDWSKKKKKTDGHGHGGSVIAFRRSDAG